MQALRLCPAMRDDIDEKTKLGEDKDEVIKVGGTKPLLLSQSHCCRWHLPQFLFGM